MAWLGKGVVGLALMLAGAGVFLLGLYHVVKTGTCATGGPYVSGRACPSGTGGWIAALVGGLFAFLAGGAVFATRGRRATRAGPAAPDQLTYTREGLAMGLFRQTKEAFQVLRSDELKDLKRKADAQPKTSMMDGIRLANEAMDQVPMWQQQGAQAAALAGNAGAYANGVAGNATVDAISDTGTMVNNAPVMELDLTVAVPGRDPYQVKHRQLVALSAIPNFQPGKTFPVHVDHQDPTKIVIG